MAEEVKLTESERMMAELLLRISTVEKLLIDKKIITVEEYHEIFTNSVSKLTEALKEQIKSTEVIPPGVLKN